VAVVTIYNAHFRFIVTLCGADSCRGLLMRQCEIERGDFPLEPQEVTMNHILRVHPHFLWSRLRTVRVYYIVTFLCAQCLDW
jgi:hypothetical protein